jgi:tetratricopeptide (TPR) repeat protein
VDSFHRLSAPWVLIASRVAAGGLVLLFGLSLPPSSWAEVKAWQGTVTIPTYPWEEDPYPKFWALEESPKLSTTVKGAIVYPYTMQDHLLRTKVDRVYKALFLENEYLKVTCLPELGGRLHSVLDKTGNQEMFHLNHVIKPSMIAMRGAFISGGVEWNAGPQGHTVTIVSPVDARLGSERDGSAYLEINNQEKIFRTRWTVRVTLHPGKAYLDERIRIANPVDGMHPYYFWNCTAFPNRPGTRFIYPMSLGTDHFGREFFSWPVHQGKDLSWLKNWETWGSVFAVGCVFDFFGAYDVEADRGIVQVADHHELPGKKAWTWGNWDFGLMSQKNLTDDDGPYIEVQSGPLPTQSDYGMLAPRDQVEWQEWWYPVHGLGDGFEFATKDIAAQTTRDNGVLELRLLATGEFPKANCTLSRGQRELLRQQVDLRPGRPAVIRFPGAGHAPLEVSIQSGGQVWSFPGRGTSLPIPGETLASFVTPLPIPKVSPPDPAKFVEKPDAQLTVEELYLKGDRYHRATNRRLAREYYEQALKKDSQYLPALRGLAVLDLVAGLYDQAASRLQSAVDRAPDDGLSWYFLGVCRLRQEKHEEALRCGYRAAHCFGTRSLSYDLAGRTHMRLKEPAKAVAAFEKAVAANSRDGRAKDHLLLALYAAGNASAALDQAMQRVAEDRTNPVPRGCLAVLTKNIELSEHFMEDGKAFIGEYDFNMLETSLVFAELGMFQEASWLVASACVDTVPPADRKALPQYYLAYYASKMGDEAQASAYLQQIRRNDPQSMYPSRPEELEILQYAVAKSPQSDYAHFALGNLFASLGRVDEAVSHWESAVQADPKFTAALRNLGLAAWKREGDLKKAANLYERAIAVRPDDQTLYRDLAEILIADGNRPEAINLLDGMPVQKDRRSEITIMLAQAYLDEKRCDDAIRLLESTPYFVNWEGQSITWRIFNEAHVKRGQQRLENKDFQGALADFDAALSYPANLNVGRSNHPEESPAWYWKGKTLAALGRSNEARAAWQQGAALPEGSAEQTRYRKLCQEELQAR